MKRHFFFDFDGTLCATEADIKTAWRAAIRELGLEAEPFERLYVTGPSIDDMVRLMWPARADAALIAAVRAAFVRLYDSGGFPATEPYAGVTTALETLRAAGARTYVVTNKRFSATHAILDKLGWRTRLFDGVYSADKYKDGPLGKLRKPALLAQAMKEQGAAPGDSVMVGDTHLDLEAGKAHGLTTVGCTWGYGSRAELAAADVLLDSPADLAARLTALGT